MSESDIVQSAVDLSSPIMATAIHDGHAVRPEIARLLSISDAGRLREEDPFTGAIARVAGTWVIGKLSRFEVDLNRSREQAVYRAPEEVWGLEIWHETPSQRTVESSLANYDSFYESVELLLRRLLDRHERVIVLDLHSYNHRRGGSEEPAADPEANPEVNIGTGSMDRVYWSGVVDRFIDDLHAGSRRGRDFDVRENVKFRGGHLCQWIHQMFPRRVCAIAIEFKKCFMDEWTGESDQERINDLALTLRSTFPGLLESLENINRATAMANAEHSWPWLIPH